MTNQKADTTRVVPQPVESLGNSYARRIVLCVGFVVVLSMALFYLRRGKDTATVKFIVPDDHNGAVYLIHDPLRGVAPNVVGDLRTYVFDARCVLRIKRLEDFWLEGEWIIADTRQGTELYVAPNATTEGPSHLSIVSYLISSEREPNVDRDYRSLVEQLNSIGVDNLDKQ